jgi:hypothetical protein
MGEPSLLGGPQRVFRFTWLRTWGKPIAVRVEVDATGATLTATRLSGQGGYDPGSVEAHATKRLTPKELAAIEAPIDALGFEKLPTVDDARGADGEEWILERRDVDAYHVVSRWTPGITGSKAAFRSVCEAFLDAAPPGVVDHRPGN